MAIFCAPLFYRVWYNSIQVLEIFTVGSLSFWIWTLESFGLNTFNTWNFPICWVIGSCSVDLMKEIEALVHRHPDKLTVCSCCWFSFIEAWCFWFGYLLSIFMQIETMKSKNKGYAAEIPVVTYRRGRNNIDDTSKFRILLVSFVFNCVLIWPSRILFPWCYF